MLGARAIEALHSAGDRPDCAVADGRPSTCSTGDSSPIVPVVNISSAAYISANDDVALNEGDVVGASQFYHHAA